MIDIAAFNFTRFIQKNRILFEGKALDYDSVSCSYAFMKTETTTNKYTVISCSKEVGHHLLSNHSVLNYEIKITQLIISTYLWLSYKVNLRFDRFIPFLGQQYFLDDIESYDTNYERSYMNADTYKKNLIGVSNVR